MSIFAEGHEQYEAMMDALKGCSGESNNEIYDFLENTPKTSLVVLLVDELHRLGFEICRKK